MAFGPYGYKPPGKFKSLEVKGTSDLDGAVNINDSGEAVDFRVEGDDETHALFVQGSSSNVGIHVSNPSTALEIDGDIQLTPTAISTAHIDATGSLKIDADNGMQIGHTDADSVKIGRTNTGLAKVHIQSGDDTDLVVSNSKTGIGTDSPTTKLQVVESSSSWAVNVANGSSGSGLEINSGSTSSHSAFKVTNHDGTVEFMRVKGDGNTGIGLSSPKTKLTVEGAVTLKEQAAADSDTAAYGQLWVKTATPNELYFTTDAGDDIQLTDGTSAAGGGGLSFDGSTANGIATYKDADEISVESTFTFDGTDALIAAAGKLQFRDTGIYAQSDEDGHLAIVSDGHVTTSGFPSTENNIGTSATSLPSIYSANGDATGEKIGYLTTTGDDALTVGKMYYLSDDPGWHATNATDDDEGAGDLIAMALNANAANDGGALLLRGLIRLDNTKYVGTAAVGKTAYMSETTAGMVDFAKPATAGNVVRVVGHCVQVDGSNNTLFYFNPSNDYGVIA